MKLIKHYDFTNMTKLDPNEWNIEVGERWANQEAQHYVNKPQNLFFDQGLVIRATHTNGVIESGRINTKGKFAFKYGRVDIVAKVPKGKGTWPAVWMMSEHNHFGYWPRSGEIDIMEHVGNECDQLYLCIHTESYNHLKKEQYFKKIDVPGFSDDFQTFSLLWKEDAISYLLNNQLVGNYYRGEAGKESSHKGWPFNDDAFHLIINLAIGGTLGGTIDYDCFPQDFIIKDIKIYQS